MENESRDSSTVLPQGCPVCLFLAASQSSLFFDTPLPAQGCLSRMALASSPQELTHTVLKSVSVGHLPETTAPASSSSGFQRTGARHIVMPLSRSFCLLPHASENLARGLQSSSGALGHEDEECCHQPFFCRIILPATRGWTVLSLQLSKGAVKKSHTKLSSPQELTGRSLQNSQPLPPARGDRICKVSLSLGLTHGAESRNSCFCSWLCH